MDNKIKSKTEPRIYVPRYIPKKKEGIGYYFREVGPVIFCAALLVGAGYVFKNGFVDSVVKPAQAYSQEASNSSTNNSSRLERDLE